MGMTIEEAIEFKKHGYHTPLSSFKNIDDMNAQISKCYEYDRLALETMRKYQKIKEIVTNNELEWGNTSVRAGALLEVKKVVEDEID